MSFTDDYLELRKKRKKEEESAQKKTSNVKRPLFVNKTAPLFEDIAPVKQTSNTKKTTTKKEEKEERTWFTKGAFDDGYQFGDISKTILGTATDVSENLTAGVLGMGEKVVDAGAYVAGGVGDLFGADEFAEKTKKFISKDLYNEEKIAKKIILGSEENSVLGEKSDSLVQSAGQLGATIGLQAVGVPWFVTTGLTGFGAEAENAFNEGATYGQAGLSAAIAAGAEILTEKIGGGISFGGKTLSDVLTHRITTGISNKVVRTLTKLGVDMVGEGTEEVLSGVMGAVGQKITYADDKELSELFSKEDALESFIGGSVLGGGMGGINAVKARKHGVDYTSGMTDSEEKVVNKVFEDRVAEEEKNGKLTERQKAKIYDEVISDMEKGGISIDTIEEVLGGDRYSNYKSVADHQDAIQQEHDTLNRMKQGEMTGEQLDRLAELKEQIKTFKETNERDNLKSQLGEEVFGLAKNSRLVESYNERTKRGQAFEADYTKYDAKQQETIKKATESGILNNTRRTHEFVDMIAKISADKGVLFDFTNNEKLKGSGFAVEGKTVNGFVTKDGVTLNIDSAKSLNSVVGHEITHVLEGTEFYNALQQTVLEYARSKGDYDARVSSVRDLYRDVKDADVAGELTADLVGDYLFTDPDFINNLSVKNRNVFQKVYDEIKYLCKVATAGSKEARELEKVKRAFEKAYKEGGDTQNDTKYSVSDSSGKELTKEQQEYFKDSKMRDDNGNLLKVYHGSPNQFTTFRQGTADGWGTGIYFTNNRAEAENYGENIVEAYLNITNPFNADTMSYYDIGAENTKAYEEYDRELWKNRYPEYDSYEEYKADGLGADMNDIYEVDVEVFNKILRELGYDGIIADGSNGIDGLEIVAFKENQAKLTTNDKPTGDPDIRYSFSKEADNAYLDAVKRGDTDNAQLMVDEAARAAMPESKIKTENGNLRVVYHGTNTGDFTEFNPDYIGMSSGDDGFFGMGFYFAYSKGEASYYGAKRIIPAYLNLKNPFNFDRELQTYKGKQAKSGYAPDAVALMNFADKFPEIAKNVTIGVAEKGSGEIKDLPLSEFAKAFKDVIENKTFEYQEVTNEYGEKETLVYTDPETHEYEYNGVKHSYKDYGFQKRFYGEPNDLDVAYEYLANSVYEYVDMLSRTRLILDNNREFTAALKEMGYDGTIQSEYGDEAVAFYPSQIKSADPVTYDGSGNVIPISERFNPENKDIRYSLSKDSKGRDLSPAVQSRFGKSKVVDEDGNLKAVYHGTATGEFSIFDKSKGSVEGDFGSGFYFTDNEADVSEHYEGGGPDFENKVARLAEQIENEEDIDYEEAEERARNELYKGSHKFEVYLNIENPAVVGETMLFDPDSYFSQYSEEDYDSYEDYEGDVEQLITDDIDGIIWDIERNIDIYSTEGIPDILYEAITEGGIGLEELKAKLNNLYLEDSNGNLVANEVARQIIESLGYDGIIDPTVSGKWNMNIAEGTKHYIVFKPNQIKAVTNQTPTDNPDIHRSLSRKGEQSAPVGRNLTYGKDIALTKQESEVSAPVSEEVSEVPVAESEELFTDDLAPMPEDDTERLDSLTDEDAPPEVEQHYQSDTITVDDPFYERDIGEVGNRKVKAYMYENPEVKPFFQQEARGMLDDLRNTTKGERTYNSHMDYEYGYEYAWSGTKRHTTDDIAELLDVYGYTYDQIEKGLNAIIEDNGAENNAVSKRIEFMLNDRLMYGYNDVDGRPYEPNQDYINLLNEKQINEYSKEAFDAFMANADDYAPISEEIEEVAPAKAAPVKAAPVAEKYEAIRPKPTKEPRMARATPEEQARAEILVEEPEAEKKKSNIMSMIRNNVLDKGMIFEDLSLATGNRELQARWNTIRYAESKAQTAMEKHLKPIIETVQKSGKTKQFYEYLYHMHNVDRMTLADRYEDTPNKAVFGDDVTADISREAASKLAQANPEFKRWAEDIYAYNRQNRELLVQGGVISREVANLWEEMYPHYVPIRRVGDTGLNINVPLDTGRTGVNAPIKRATGGNSDILPLFDTLGQRTMQTYKAVAKNRFGVELKNTLGTTIDSEGFDIDEAIDSVDTHEELLQEGKNGKKPTFTVFENGEKVTFEITEEMYDAMKPKSKGMAYTNKKLNWLNNVRRGLLTEYNPAFMLTNPIKDAQDVLLNSQHPAQTYKNFPKAIAELFGKKGHWYQEYMDNGGERNTYFDNETNTFVEKGRKGLAKLAGIPLDKISEANNFIERVPRLAEYIASREAGRSVDVAMLDAARVTTNFAAGGDLVKLANRNGFTFLNASMQGAMQQVRNVREAKQEGLKGWATLAAKVAVAGLPSILLNNLLWDDDEEYEELSDYVKQNYYVVAKYGDGQFVRIPKGRALAVIQNGFEQMANLVTGNDEVDLRTFGELLVSNLAPNNPLENNIIAPVTQALTNKAWYGGDLVPTRLQDLPAAEQYDESTDALSKWLGEKAGEIGIDISPYKINYVLDQYSGGVGDMVLPYLTQEAERGKNSLFAPILDKFTTDSVMKNQNVSDFYDTKDELAVTANSSDATDEDVLKSKFMNSVNSELGKLYGEKREIQNSDLPDDEKYEAVREIQKQIDEMAELSLHTYEDVNIEGDYGNIGDKYFHLNEEGEWQKLSADQTTKYLVTKDAGDSPYATNGEVHYRWYEPGEDSDAEPGWRKITDDQLEKQREVTKGLGISPEEYWGNKEEYDYAYEHPENYAVAKAVGGYSAYRTYSSELYDIKADKDSNGKSISGSRKEKVADYINGLDADYYTKIILFKSEYNSEDTYNYEIIEYLNGREDISFEEKIAILRKLGFEVDNQGNISW